MLAACWRRTHTSCPGAVSARYAPVASPAAAAAWPTARATGRPMAWCRKTAVAVLRPFRDLVWVFCVHRFCTLKAGLLRCLTLSIASREPSHRTGTLRNAAAARRTASSRVLVQLVSCTFSGRRPVVPRTTRSSSVRQASSAVQRLVQRLVQQLVQQLVHSARSTTRPASTDVRLLCLAPNAPSIKLPLK